MLIKRCAIEALARGEPGDREGGQLRALSHWL